MARVVKEAEYAAKRTEILNAAERLIYSKGYGNMTIQDILDELRISKGAFYHYFDSKPVVLEALIGRMQQTAEEALLPIVHDPHLNAIEKLQRFFRSLERSSLSQQAFVVDLLRVWFADENAIVREKVYEGMSTRRAPLLTQIIRQGIQEGVFAAPYPEQTSELVLALARSMGTAVARLMFAYVKEHDEARFTADFVATFAACVDGVERLLGAPSHSLYRYDSEAAKLWITMLDTRSS